MREPIVLAEIAPGRFNVIDGHHRLEKAYRSGISQMLAYKVQAEQHGAFLTLVEAYQRYIAYGNSKIRKTLQEESFVQNEQCPK